LPSYEPITGGKGYEQKYYASLAIFLDAGSAHFVVRKALKQRDVVLFGATERSGFDRPI